MQQKKAQYEIYSSMLDNQIKHAKVIFDSILPKRPSDSDVLEVLFKQAPQVREGLNLLIFSDEHHWIRNGANTIFPENSAVLESLLRAKFQMEAAEGFSLPFESFMVSIPQGFKVDGMRVPSFLVSMFPYHKLNELIVGPFTRHARFSKPVNVRLDEAPADEIAISLCYKDPTSTTAYARTLISTGQIPSILESTSMDELTEGFKPYVNYRGIVGLSEYDLKIQRVMLKLVAALGVYNMATEGKRLLPGLPGSLEPKLIGKAPTNGLSSSTLANPHSSTGIDSRLAGDSFYRSWFFRQLRDERYYKGENAHFTKGSRYVFVSDTVVGKTVEAHTQKFTEKN
jgi:hypothetical protein